MSIHRYGQPLTPREGEILQLVSQGLSYRQAGLRVRPAVTENTAKAHMQRVLTKLGASTAPQAVLLACQAGLLDGRPRRHGDHAGYAAHVYRGEDPCEACWDGERQYRAARRAARRAAKSRQREAA